MGNEPAFTAEENLNSVLFSKSKKFVIVEGPFDRVIYSEVYEVLEQLSDLDLSNHLIIFGGGKKEIETWYMSESPRNAKCIFDRYFDCSDYNMPKHSYVELNRYSIENYFFDKSVVFPFLRLVLSINIDQIEDKIDFVHLFSHWTTDAKSLLSVLYYYQKIYVSDNKDKWDAKFLCKNDSHELCEMKVEALVNKLLTDMGVTLDICTEAFNDSELSLECLSRSFPGKLLLESYYRFLKFTCSGIKRDSSGYLTNSKGLVAQLIPRLINNGDLKSKLLLAAS
ncbi:DUF4435 domain-containing protein [Vibrio splendidus]